MGDIVLTSPIIRCLKQQTGAELHFFTKKAFGAVLENNPHIYRVHLLDKNMPEICARLKQEKFDCIVDLHNNLRTLRVKRALGCDAWSFPKLNFKKWLYVKLKLDFLPDVHVVDRYFEAVKPLKVINDGKGLDYFLPEITGPHLAPNKPYIAFVLGATHNTKRLEPDQMIQICQMIQSPVVLLGGRAESDLGAQIAERCAAKTDLYNLSGKTSLHQSADVIRQASVVLTHDTGLMHIAAAFQRPIILIWGNTTPRLGMYPYDPENKGDYRSFEVQNLPCRPCSKIGHESCPKVHFKCMRLQPLAEIAAQADDLCKNRK